MTGDPQDYRADEGSTRKDEDRHVEDLRDGSGCTEIWEHLSERRETSGDD